MGTRSIQHGIFVAVQVRKGLPVEQDAHEFAFIRQSKPRHEGAKFTNALRSQYPFQYLSRAPRAPVSFSAAATTQFPFLIRNAKIVILLGSMVSGVPHVSSLKH